MAMTRGTSVGPPSELELMRWRVIVVVILHWILLLGLLLRVEALGALIGTIGSGSGRSRVIS